MPSIIEGYNYDIFISYRQKDNKHNGWVTEFVNNLKGELESTFKEDISVYFDINPHDGLLETHDVDESLKDKLKCLVFIPIISRTYCDPKSFAWEHEFKAFVELASKDQFGLKVKLPNGNVASRVLPVRIYDLDDSDIRLCESVLGGVLRSVDFIYKSAGVNRPLRVNEDHPQDNLNKTYYRDQINKVANSIKENINSIRLRKHKPEEKSEEVIAPKSVLRKDHKIKILAGSLIGLALIVLGILFIPKLFKPSEQIEKSIAVLPFINDSPDEGNEYFCNGMMEEIMNHLQNIGGLKVKSRTSVEKYRNLQKDIKDIGHELDVSFILEGSVRKSGDDLRIATQLIDAKTGDHLWSHIYNGKYTDRIFEFQSDVSRKVAESLHAVISPEEERRIDSKPTSEIMAYDLCSRGNEMLAKWDYTYDSVYLRSALNLFNRALKIDPEFPDAFSGKGRAYNLSGNYDSAMFYYKRVELLDPHNINSAYGIGVVYMYSGKPDSALKYLEKVVKSIPDNCAYNISTGQVLLFNKNDLIKALPYFQKAYDLEGNSNPWVNEWIAYMYLYLSDYPKSIRHLNISLSLKSEYNLIVRYNGILMAQGKYTEAIHFLDSIRIITPYEQLCDVLKFHVLTAQKDFKNAEKLYNKAASAGYKRDRDDIYIGYLYKETGREKEAITILRNSIRRNDSLLKTVKNNMTLIEINVELAAAHAILGEKFKG